MFFPSYRATMTDSEIARRDAYIHVLEQELVDAQVAQEVPQWIIRTSIYNEHCDVRIQIVRTEITTDSSLDVAWRNKSDFFVRSTGLGKTEICTNNSRGTIIREPSVLFTITDTPKHKICYTNCKGIYVDYESGILLRDIILNNFESFS